MSSYHLFFLLVYSQKPLVPKCSESPQSFFSQRSKTLHHISPISKIQMSCQGSKPRQAADSCRPSWLAELGNNASLFRWSTAGQTSTAAFRRVALCAGFKKNKKIKKRVDSKFNLATVTQCTAWWVCLLCNQVLLQYYMLQKKVFLNKIIYLKQITQNTHIPFLSCYWHFSTFLFLKSNFRTNCKSNRNHQASNDTSHCFASLKGRMSLCSGAFGCKQNDKSNILMRRHKRTISFFLLFKENLMTIKRTHTIISSVALQQQQAAESDAAL